MLGFAANAIHALPCDGADEHKQTKKRKRMEPPRVLVPRGRDDGGERGEFKQQQVGEAGGA